MAVEAGGPACRPARAGCHAVRTARSWRGIVAFTHPRAGGAYDSHHRTAEIACRTRRRDGVAARGARAAGGNARDRPSDYFEALRSELEYLWAQGRQPAKAANSKQFDSVPSKSLPASINHSSASVWEKNTRTTTKVVSQTAILTPPRPRFEKR